MSSSSTQPSDREPKDQPPDYDTLSIAPPSVNQDAPSSSRTRPSADLSEPSTSARREPSTSKWKQKWQELKEEDERRKADRIQHVTPEEADRITGLDKHRSEEERKSAERKRGGKSMLGVLAMC